MISTFFKFAIVGLAMALFSLNSEGREIRAKVVYFQQSKEDPIALFTPAEEEDQFLKIVPSYSVDSDLQQCFVNDAGNIVFGSNDNPETSEIIAIAAIPKEVTQAILFLFKSPNPTKKTGKYQVLVVNEAKSKFLPGGCFLCNLSKENARIKIGDGKFALLPGKSAYTDRPENIDAYNMADFLLQVEKNGKWIQIRDTMMRFAEVERYLIFVYPDESNSAVKVYKQVVHSEP